MVMVALQGVQLSMAVPLAAQAWVVVVWEMLEACKGGMVVEVVTEAVGALVVSSSSREDLQVVLVLVAVVVAGMAGMQEVS